MVAAAQQRFGGLDILVNNAGLTFTYTDPDRFVNGPRKFWELTDEIVQNTMDTNYMVADQLARRVAPILMARGWGRIVNVTTKLDTMNMRGRVPYGPSKAALEMATEIWAKELAGTGVTVNIVNPGAGANTPGMAKEMREWSATGKAAEAGRAGRDGGAAALRRLARGRHGEWLSLRRQHLAGRRCRRPTARGAPAARRASSSIRSPTASPPDPQGAMTMDWNPKPLDPGRCDRAAPRPGKPLVLLHCLGMDWHFWDVLEPLTDQFELIAYSLPGHHDTHAAQGPVRRSRSSPSSCAR